MRRLNANSLPSKIILKRQNIPPPNTKNVLLEKLSVELAFSKKEKVQNSFRLNISHISLP